MARICGIGAALVLANAAPAVAQIYSDVYVFGDSLSDTGNACTVLGIAGYKLGRCSNGDVWSERFAEILGHEAKASSQGGTNFAIGGDETRDLDEQILAFSILEFGSADPDALYVIWLGGNDVLGIPSSPTAMQDAVDNVIDGIRALQNLGAEHFLIPNLPDIGRAYGNFALPVGSGAMFTPAERDAVTALSLDFNTQLAAALDAETITTLFELDIEALVEELFANPSAFGLSPAAIDTASDDTDFGVPCLVDSSCAADPRGAIADTFFLFDAIHPTTAMHAVIANRAATLVPEPDPAWAMGASLWALVALSKLRSRRRDIL